MGSSNQRRHFDKKNSARAKGRRQEHVFLDGDAFLKTLKQEQKNGVYNIVEDDSQPN